MNRTSSNYITTATLTVVAGLAITGVGLYRAGSAQAVQTQQSAHVQMANNFPTMPPFPSQPPFPSMPPFPSGCPTGCPKPSISPTPTPGGGGSTPSPSTSPNPSDSPSPSSSSGSGAGITTQGGQVSGATTYAKTGGAADLTMTLLGSTGVITAGAGWLLNYRKH